MDRGSHPGWFAHCALLERHGDSARLLRELALRGTFVAARHQLERVEREGLLTGPLLDALAALPGMKNKTRSLLQARRGEPMSALPAAAGRVWVPYIASRGRTQANVPIASSGEGDRPESVADGTTVALSAPAKELISFVVPITCFVDAAGTPSLVTGRTAPWKTGLTRLVHITRLAVLGTQANAADDWADGCVQFDLLGERLGGALDPSDRSYELAAVVAMVSAAYGRVLDAGIAAIGLISSETRDFGRPLSRKIESVGADALRIKLEGLVHALPILSVVLVPHSDVEFAHRLLSRTRIRVIGVGTIEDVFSVAGGFSRDFRGRIKKSAWRGLSERTDRAGSSLRARLPGKMTDADFNEYAHRMTHDLSTARTESGYGIGMFSGLIAVAAYGTMLRLYDRPMPILYTAMIFLYSNTATYLIALLSMQTYGGWPLLSYPVSFIGALAFWAGWLSWRVLWAIAQLNVLVTHPLVRVLCMSVLTYGLYVLARAGVLAVLRRFESSDKEAFWLPFVRINAILVLGSVLLFLHAPVLDVPLTSFSLLALGLTVGACIFPRRLILGDAVVFAYGFFRLACLGLVAFVAFESVNVHSHQQGWGPPSWLVAPLRGFFIRHAKTLIPFWFATASFAVSKLLLVYCEILRLEFVPVSWRRSCDDIVPLDPSEADIYSDAPPIETARPPE